MVRNADRVCIYGTGGCGKTTLLHLLTRRGIKGKLFDLESGSNHLDFERVDGVKTFGDLIDALYDKELWEGYKAVMLDTMTAVEEMAVRWVVETIPHEKGHRVKDLDSYGFGKGVGHVFDQMLKLFAALDSHYRAGRHVIVTAHDCIAEFPNPTGENYIRFEPRLQSPKSGKDSVRLRLKEWADSLFFVGYDVSANRDGKATGSGTRSIYTTELPHCMAKSRYIAKLGPVPFRDENDGTLWEKLLGA